MTATIGIEASSIIKQRTGIGQYNFHLLGHLSRLDRTYQYRIFTNSLKDKLVDSPFASASHFHHIHSKIPGKLLLEMWRLFRRPVIEHFTGPVDLFHSTNNNPVPQKGGIRLLTVYDLFFMHHPERTDRYGGQYFYKVLPRYIREWDHIITISKAMKYELIRVFGLEPRTISVIYCGLDPAFWEPVADADTLDFPVTFPDNFCLAVGTLEPRKNYSTLLKAFRIFLDRINKSFYLIISGIDGSSSGELHRLIRDLDLVSKVLLLGYLSQKQLQLCYQRARFFAMVSLYEGFGIPVLEAMSCGTPVIASNTTSFPEVVADAGILVNPQEPEQISQAMLDLMNDVGLQNRLVQRGYENCKRFTWETTARETLALYRRLLGS